MLDKIITINKDDSSFNQKNDDNQSIIKPNPSLYIDRELSWLEFNKRVLEESKDDNVPLLERLKFCSIFSSNMDEFFMVRVGRLYRFLNAGIEYIDPCGNTLNQELDAISVKSHELVNEQYRHIDRNLIPELQKQSVEFFKYDDLNKKEKESLEKYFDEQIYPLLTPFAVDAGHPFPFLSNLKLNIMVCFKRSGKEESNNAYAFVEVPSMISRLIPVNQEKSKYNYILVEEVIKHQLHKLFPGMDIINTVCLRVTRNQDYDLHEDEVSDIAMSVKSELRDRSNQLVVRIEVDECASDNIVELLSKHINVSEKFIYKINGPINISYFMSLYDLPLENNLKEVPFNPRIPNRFASDKDIFSVIREGDVLLHHPFDSFAVYLDFINTAADDPNVLAIKQTLYRIGSESPIVVALRKAAENGKQVTAVIELKARFEEEHNIDWALKMRDSGVNVVFGFVQEKTHCKATLVVRREGSELRRYVHLSTGNYNTNTAKSYTDIGLFTCNPDFGNDVTSLFNVLTGFNSWTDGEMFPKKKVTSMFHQFMISPVNTYKRFSKLIDREIEKVKAKSNGRIIAKMNALSDPNIINKLYEASQAGVKIDLIVRGICCLVPGIPGVSDNITVTSIVDRFLEHSRIYYFHNGGDPEIYSGSADWMQRNFHTRVEVIYPIIDNELKKRIINEILMTYLSDNTKSWKMKSDGSYVRQKRKDNETAPVRSQAELIEVARRGGVKSPPYEELIKKIGSGKKIRK